MLVSPVPPLATGNAVVRVTAPVTARVVERVVAPLALSVPVTATPVAVAARIVVAPDNRDKLPDESAVVTTPPPPVVIAAIVEVMLES